ncbi:MAG TPA: hypothetical protein VGG39_35130 [Polyangiaceae bacterium]|jgi:hypothetical protein
MNTMDRWNTEKGIRRSEHMAVERAHTAQLANHLSSVAVRQWEKTLTGIVALPAAAALGVAATATYGVALLERAFEVFETAIGDVGRTVSEGRRDGETTDLHESRESRNETHS